MKTTLRTALSTLSVLTLALFIFAPGGSLLAEPGDKHAKKDKWEKGHHEAKAKGDHGHYDEAALTAKYQARGWTGISTEKNEDGWYAINEVASYSPAYEAGLRPGDVLLAFNGVPLKTENKDKLKAAKAEMKVGGKVTYVVLRDGEKKKVTVGLAPVPDTVLAQWLSNAREQANTEQTQMAEKNR